MKTKTLKKVLITLGLILIISLIVAPFVFGLSNPDQYNPANTPQDNDAFVGKVNIVLGVIQIIGSITSVAVLAVIGIKYMFGSIEEKAEYKKRIVPYIVGAILLFSCSNLVQIVYNFATEMENEINIEDHVEDSIAGGN